MAVAKPSMSINLGLQPAPEVDSPELYGSLLPIYNAIRNLGYGLDAYTGNAQIDKADYSEINAFGQLLLQKTAVLYVKAYEAISTGQVVSMFNSGGLTARLSVGNTYRPQAFALDKAAAGQHLPVCFFGLCQVISGMTPGTVYYSSATPGALTNAATYTRVGVALAADKLWFNPA